jgi:hypothetical protein
MARADSHPLLAAILYQRCQLREQAFKTMTCIAMDAVGGTPLIMIVGAAGSAYRAKRQFR